MSSAAAAQTLRFAHPELEALFKAAESRQLTEQERGLYLHYLPDQQARADAAREVAAAEAQVVSTSLQDVYKYYPAYFERYVIEAPHKAARDVTYASAYATMAMLMNDPQWQTDKLLYWFRTIVHSFEFPGRVTKNPDVIQDPEIKALLKQSAEQPEHIRVIDATYRLMHHHYHKVLSPAAWTLMAPYLQQTIDIMSATE